MNAKQQKRSLAIILILALFVFGTVMLADQAGYSLSLTTPNNGGNDGGNATPEPTPDYPWLNTTPPPQQDDPTTQPTPEPTVAHPRYLQVSTRDTIVSPYDEVYISVYSSLANIDVYLWYGYASGLPDVLSYEPASVHAEPVLAGFEPILVHIGEDNYGSAILQLGQGTYTVSATSLDGIVTSNSVQVQVVVIY